MRLVCPNCDAKYEVPEDAIPETGRDVQCANCGHAWFQMRSRVAEAAVVAAPTPAAVAAPAAPPAPPAPEPIAEPVVEAAAPAPVEPEPVAVAEVMAEPEPVIVTADVSDVPMSDPPSVDVAVDEGPVPEAVEPVADVAADAPEVIEEAAQDFAVAEGAAEEAAVEVPFAAEGAASPEPTAEVVADPVVEADVATEAADDAVDIPASTGAIAAAGVAAYAVDDSVLAILREEAEREAHARKADAAKPLETQTDLGLDAAIPALRKGQMGMQTDPVSGDETPDDKHAVRRTRLPDVEEINSTLRPSELAETEAEAAAMVPVAEGRSSFRSGFLLVMTLAILASAIYGSADVISSVVPALEGPLMGFVGFIDSLRLQLDGLMQSATVAIGSN